MESEGDGYTEDGSVNLKGKPVLRSETGRWKACSFIIGYEVFERMAYQGISSNLVVYLTKKLHEGTVTSANNVTNWAGTVWMTPILGAYIADAYLGRYWTFIIASVIYLSGMSLLTLTVSLPQLRPPSCGSGINVADCHKHASSLQTGIFYCALYIIAVGSGGTKPNISTLGADQFDDFEPKERTQKLSFFNWWSFSVFVGTLFSNTFLIYIQDNVGWTLGYGIPTLGHAVSIVVFIAGSPFYRHKVPYGSPFTRMAQVLVAASRKWNVKVPNDSKELHHELSSVNNSNLDPYKIDHSSSIRFLDKAAVKTSSSSPWMLCPVTQVEQTKQMVKMLPVLIVTFIPSAVVAQVSTLFIKQGTTLDRSMGPHFKIPPACLTVFLIMFMLIGIALYDRYFVPFIRKYTGNPRGITLLQRMGIGFVLHIINMVVALSVDRRRISVAHKNGIFQDNQTIPLSVFILLPQFAIMGLAECLSDIARLEFFYDQAPQGMKSLGTAYYTTSHGIGQFLSSFLLKTVARITKKNDNQGWILNNLNISHLDKYYGFLAVLASINFIVFLVVARSFKYNAELSRVYRDLPVESLQSSSKTAPAEDLNE